MSHPIPIPKYNILIKLTIEEGLNLINPPFTRKNESKIKEINGIKFKVTSTKLRTYLLKGTECYRCGKRADFFAIVNGKHQEPFLEMFKFDNRDKNRTPIPFTQDHIIPLSKGGGRRNMGNLQPLCYVCNQQKRDENVFS